MTYLHREQPSISCVLSCLMHLSAMNDVHDMSSCSVSICHACRLHTIRRRDPSFHVPMSCCHLPCLLQIENIHVVRTAFHDLRSLFHTLASQENATSASPPSPRPTSTATATASLPPVPASFGLDRTPIATDTLHYLAALTSTGRYTKLLDQLHRGAGSRWLRHVASVMDGAQLVVDSITRQSCAVW